VKIGRTSQEEVGTRLAQLYTTGVPVPFELKYACRVPNSDEVESALHIAFGPQRINPRREFFRIEPEQAIAILKLLHVEDATAEVAAQTTGIDEQSLAAAEGMRHRPRAQIEWHIITDFCTRYTGNLDFIQSPTLDGWHAYDFTLKVLGQSLSI
jgi:hypothetical protein